MINYSEHPVFATAVRPEKELSADELSRIRHLLERLPNSAAVNIERELGDSDLSQMAMKIFQARRDIEAKFFGQVANDPSIDLLLQFFIARSRGEMLTVSEACASTSAAPTTALRRLTVLTEQGHIERFPHRHDKRTVFVKLSDSATAMMRIWLSKTHATL